MMTNFIVVETPSAYNVILKRPTLNRARVVVSTHSLVVKFPTPQGTKILKGDQATAKSCYVTYLCKGALPETLAVEDPNEEKDGMSPIEELTQIALNPKSPDHFVSIRSLLSPKLQGILVQLKQNQDVFAWSHKDMPGIDPRVMSH